MAKQPWSSSSGGDFCQEASLRMGTGETSSFPRRSSKLLLALSVNETATVAGLSKPSKGKASELKAFSSADHLESTFLQFHWSSAVTILAYPLAPSSLDDPLSIVAQTAPSASHVAGAAPCSSTRCGALWFEPFRSLALKGQGSTLK